MTREHGPKPFSQKEQAHREQVAIIRMREEGYSNQEIANKLKISYPVLISAVFQLIRSGKVKKRKRGAIPLSQEERRHREETIIRMREQGCSNQEIADELEIARRTLRTATTSLLKAKKIKKQKCGFCSVWQNLASRQTRSFIAMVRRKKSCKEIGDRFGFSKQRAHQIIEKLKQYHGKGILMSADSTE